MANSDKVLGQVMQDAVEEKIEVTRKFKVGIWLHTPTSISPIPP